MYTEWIPLETGNEKLEDQKEGGERSCIVKHLETSWMCEKQETEHFGNKWVLSADIYFGNNNNNYLFIF